MTKVSLQAHNNQYLCAEGGGGSKLVANRNQVSEWETFTLHKLRGNKIALQANNGQFFCAEGGGGREVVANRPNISEWETFTLHELGGNKIALQANNGQFLCAEGGGGREVVANRPEISEWEIFVKKEIANNKSTNLINKIVELTNIERQKANLPKLRLNAQLSVAAQTHSQNMALQDFYSHTDPSGKSPGDRIHATGYRWIRWAENIHTGVLTPKEAVQAWMNSPGHRDNILNPKMKEIGVGYYFLAQDTGRANSKHYWTQVFAAPSQK